MIAAFLSEVEENKTEDLRQPMGVRRWGAGPASSTPIVGSCVAAAKGGAQIDKRRGLGVVTGGNPF